MSTSLCQPHWRPSRRGSASVGVQRPYGRSPGSHLMCPCPSPTSLATSRSPSRLPAAILAVASSPLEKASCHSQHLSSHSQSIATRIQENMVEWAIWAMGPMPGDPAKGQNLPPLGHQQLPHLAQEDMPHPCHPRHPLPLVS